MCRGSRPLRVIATTQQNIYSSSQVMKTTSHVTCPPLSHVHHYHMSPPLSSFNQFPLRRLTTSTDSPPLPSILPRPRNFPTQVRCFLSKNFYKFVLVVFVTIVIVINIIMVIINISGGRRPRNFQTKMPSPTTAPILTRYTTLCPHYIIYIETTLLPTTYLLSTMITKQLH